MRTKSYKSLYLKEKIERETYENMFNFLIKELKNCEHIQVIEEKHDIPYKYRAIEIMEDYKYLCNMAINDYMHTEIEEEE